MTHSYINIMAIALIEVVFFIGLKPAVNWLTESFGASTLVWGIAMLTLNFLILSIPIYHLVNNVKFLDELVITGARHIANREGSKSEPMEIYQKFLDINTYMVVMVIDALIILLVPNYLGLWQHLVVLGVAAVILLVFYFRRFRARPDAEAPEDEQEE